MQKPEYRNLRKFYVWKKMRKNIFQGGLQHGRVLVVIQEILYLNALCFQSRLNVVDKSFPL
jgi:hypothetical protein